METIVKTKKTNGSDKAIMHQATGNGLPMIPNLENLSSKEQAKILNNFFSNAQSVITKLDIETDKEAKELRRINKAINQTPLKLKLKARTKALKEKNELREELRSRYTGALDLAKALGLKVDTDKIQMIEG